MKCICGEAGKRGRPVLGGKAKGMWGSLYRKVGVAVVWNVGEIRHKSVGNQALLVVLLTENLLVTKLPVLILLFAVRFINRK